MEAVDAGIEQVRAIAHQLRPPELDSLGLRDALVSHAEKWSVQVGLELHLQCDDVNPSMEVAEALFRSAQEALTNVARHAQASIVHVSLEWAGSDICLTIEDNGVGMADIADGRLGLVGIRERLRKCNGQLNLESGDLGGLKLVASAPMELETKDEG